MPPITSRLAALLLILMSAALSACNFNLQPPTPTVESIESPTPDTLTPAVTPTASLSTTPPSTVVAIRLASITPSDTGQPSTETATPTETPGHYVHRIVPGDALFNIIIRFGYRDASVFPAIQTANPSIPDLNNLPPGQEILIPRMTHTPTPPQYEATLDMLATRGVRNPDALAPGTQPGSYTVEEGESIIDIAIKHSTTLEVLSRLNPEISFAGCDFNIRSGGEGCAPLIIAGQSIVVPLPTATPTLSPTPSGNETATPTPTYNPPITNYPPNGALVSGTITMQWLSVGILEANEFYYVEVKDITSGQEYTTVTKDTSLTLPLELIPPEGQQHDIEWQVAVVRGSGEDYSLIGGVMPSPRTFKWQRR